MKKFKTIKVLPRYKAELEEKQLSDEALMTDITSKDLENNVTVEYFVTDMIEKNEIILFSRTYCPFSFELKRTLISYGVHFAVYEVDQVPHLNQGIKDVLMKLSGFSTTPNLFVNNKSVGGCTDTKIQEYHGKLLALLAPYVDKPLARNPIEIQGLGILYYPDTVNMNYVRASTILTGLVIILCGYYFDHPVTPWVVLGLALDMAVRGTYGWTVSVSGIIGYICVNRIKPKYAPGPPFQFALALGTSGAIIASALLFAGYHYYGLAILIILEIICILEGIFGVCSGCYIYDMMVHYKLVSPSTFYAHLNLFTARAWLTHFQTSLPGNLIHPVNEHVLLPGQTKELPIDIIRKVRNTFEYKLKDYDIIKHCQITWFVCPMTIGALAYMFQLINGNHLQNNVSFSMDLVNELLFLLMVLITIVVTILYSLRTLLYFQKVSKDWNHPTKGNYFNTIPIICIFIGLLWLPYQHYYGTLGGLIFIYIGAILQLILSVIQVANCLFHTSIASSSTSASSSSSSYMNGSWLFLGIGNYIVVLGIYQLYLLTTDTTLSNYNTSFTFHGLFHYGYLTRIWFGIGTLLSVLYVFITFQHHQNNANQQLYEKQNRMLLFTWLTIFSLCGIVYSQVTTLSLDNNSEDSRKGVVFQSIYGISFFLFLVFSIGWLQNYFIYTIPFDMSIWIMPFGYITFAIITLHYNEVIHSPTFFHIVVLITLLIAILTTSMCGFHTLLAIINGTLFLPCDPHSHVNPSNMPLLSYLTLSHETFRITLPKLILFLNEHLEKHHENAVKNFLNELEQFFLVYELHIQQKENMIFPTLSRYYPNLIELGYHEIYELQYKRIELMRKAIIRYYEDIIKQPETAAVSAGMLIRFLRNSLPSLSEHILKNLREEELIMFVVIRKRMSLAYQIEVYHTLFNTTTNGNEWRKIISFIVKHLPVPEWKIQFITTLVMSNPNQIEEIGLMIYSVVDHVTWLLIIHDLPMIIPRGLSGYHKLY